MLDRFGNVVDGLHRSRTDPKWKAEKLDWVKTDKDRVLVKLHANYRRSISKEELSREFIKLADILVRENKIEDPRDAASAIAKLVPYTERYVREILPPQYKHTEYSHVKEEFIPPDTARQEEEFISQSESASTYNPPSGRVLAQGILPVEWFTIGGSRCLVNWEERKIWAMPKADSS